MPPAKTQPSQLKGTQNERGEHSPATYRRPDHVSVRKESGKTAYWAARGREQELRFDGYQPVRYGELETMQGGQFAPHDKDFGVYWDVSGENKDDVVRLDGKALMWAMQDTVNKRRAEEADRMRNLQPKKTDPGEKARINTLDETTMGKEWND